jgi:gluconolactonase
LNQSISVYLTTTYVANGRVVISFLENGERPSNFVLDGMTIDADGNLYVTTFGKWTIFKVNPKSNKIELEIKMPSEQITSCAFGGPNLDILYVTSASQERATKQPPPAGRLFKITGLGAKGLPMASVKLN